MELYRVLLVDDEEDIRVGISQKMDWESLGFALVGEAENGRDALELADQLHPDVILTDIKMPFMDGLDLCRILTVRLPASKFVVFSGFDDFEYAKQAIRMNVSEYILKPINAAELHAVLQKLKEQLDTERAERQNMETLRRRYEESLPVLRSLFLSRLLSGQVAREQVAELAARYEVDLSGASWTVALAHVSGDAGRNELLPISVQQLFEENLQLEGCSCQLFMYNGFVAVLGAFQSGVSIYDFIEAVNRVCALAESYLGLDLTVGVGAACSAVEDLSQSADGARSALEYRSLVGRGRAIYIGDLEPDAGVRLAFGESDEQQLTSAIKLCGEDEVRSAVGYLMDRLRASGRTMSQCQLFFLELLTCLLKLTRAADLELEAVFGSNFSGTVNVTDFDSPEQLGDWCLERCLKIQSLIRRQRTDSAGRTVERAKKFIQEHYAESELSVEMLCEHLHLSPTYFSTLFKREVGMSFTAYVTVVRMEAAAAALRNTEEKTYLIARQCGYDDPNYFSYVFKRHFGVSPTKYRAG
jgi:two-component system response regulator YesN